MMSHALRGRYASVLAILVAVLLVGGTLPARAQHAAQPKPVEPELAQPKPVEPKPVEPESAQSETRQYEPLQKESIVHEIHNANERMEMTVNTSRILKLEKRIPQAQANNPDVLELTPLSPTEIQVFAKGTGVTQVNLWDENKKIYTVDVIVYGDAQELIMLLQSEFPNATLRIKPMSNGVLISGYVDQPNHVSQIVQIAEEFYPKVLNNITVSGVQQVLLHTKIIEVSRSKMRSLGFDFAKLTGRNLVASTASGLVSAAFAGSAGTGGTAGNSAIIGGGSNPKILFQVFGDNSGFLGVLEAMRNDQLLKIMAEPTLVTVSGRPARFNSGGEFPILIPQSLGTVSVKYKPYGTQVDFVPIVLGNGRLRLEVRPRVSEIDPTLSVELDNSTIPALKVREVETGVEMQTGQTLAIAGLVFSKTEAQRRGIPWAGDLPWIGALFRRTEEQINEVELLILVTPEIVDGMDPCQVPSCGPGMGTTSPTDVELALKGHIEVPNCAVVGPRSGYADAAGPIGQFGPSQAPVDGDPMILREVEPIPTPKAGTPEAPRSRPAAPAGNQSVRRSPGPTASIARSTPSARPHNRSNRQTAPQNSQSARNKELPGFIGPIGYDAVK